MGKESLVLSEYTSIVYKGSQYIKGKSVVEKEIVCCPRCSNKIDKSLINNLPETRCECGLWIESYGNALYIWE